VAIENQLFSAIVTSILVAMLLQCKMGNQGVGDEKSLKKQDLRQTSETDGTDRPEWTTPIFRYPRKSSWTGCRVRHIFRLARHNDE